MCATFYFEITESGQNRSFKKNSTWNMHKTPSKIHMTIGSFRDRIFIVYLSHFRDRK